MREILLCYCAFGLGFTIGPIVAMRQRDVKLAAVPWICLEALIWPMTLAVWWIYRKEASGLVASRSDW
jgi:hypothetical protein